MPLTQAQASELYAESESRKANSPKHSYTVRTPEGLVTLRGKPPAHSNPHFTGRQGSTRRSSKGRTSIMPNGRRYLLKPYDAELDIVAYSL